MEIVEQIKEHSVTDYEFVFDSGNKLSITIDHDAGDTVFDYGTGYHIGIVARQSLVNPEEIVDAEEIEIFKTNLAFVSKRNRKHRLPNQNEKMDIKTLLGLETKGVQ